ncbi:MAG TPA: caspase family protein [Oscillatoriaceae cyanobacterium M33_DOE_052]|uniref:DUF4384 domain-containing protein n=1 Tax=Planktothricoides sp. SpSt-374 TaxID=2282167 RepID=A0A7C3VL48_9CYAN|nr:caspase family protein [Oscillatoriaceae cyanobacterium M33_DOE_052]
MGLNRREFLQRASGVLATMGISETLLWQMGDRYYQALAQPTAGGAPRKLALLVGINRLPSGEPKKPPGGEPKNASPAGVPLTGCLTDVELQQELLTNRLGFRPRDILTLTDAQATRQNIEEAFLNHLTAQAAAGDVVLFHFSGYGRSLYRPSPGEEERDAESTKPHHSLVPVDGGSANGEDSSVNDLLLETLWLLLGTLNTNRALVVLDTSYAYPGSNWQGNLRIRSRPSPATPILNPQARDFQATLRAKNSKLNQKLPWLGTVLAATSPDLIAAEARWEGFSSGVFTYALTQQLWLATSAHSLQFTMQGASCVVGQVAGSEQQPQLMEFDAAKKLDKLIQPIETTLIQDAPSADGAVTAYDEGSKTGSIWLGGLPPLVLQSYEENSLLEVVPPVGVDEGRTKLLVRSRDGLTAKVQILTPETSIQPGQLVQEYLRVLPRNIKLSIALDPSLQRIERVDATSAFAAIANVSPVVADSGSADCLFGRVQEVALAQIPGASLPALPQGSYGLFSLGRTLLPNSVGEGGEAVKMAAQRLIPQLQTLRAVKLIRLTANEGASRLGVGVTLEMIAPLGKTLLQAVTWRAKEVRGLSLKGAVGDGIEPGQIMSLSQGSRIRYRVENYRETPIYCLLFGLHNSGSPIASYPSFYPPEPQGKPTLEQNLIPGGTTCTIPGDISEGSFPIKGTPGLAETYLICSDRPFQKTFLALAGAMDPRLEPSGIITLRQPTTIAQAILQDLQQSSLAASQEAGISSDYWGLDANTWATIPFIYRVV